MESFNHELRKPVAQEDGLGCAVASTAFVLGVSYQEAVSLFEDGERRVKEEADFYCPEIVKILKEKGLNYSWAKLDENNKNLIEKDLSIVFVEPSPELPFGHFVARFKDKWMDPWINLPNPQRESGFRDILPGKPSYVIYSRE